jgi:hypothetical protein
LPVERFAEILAELKPRFIHHSEVKRLLQLLLLERGCNIDKTYFDVPRLRTSTSDSYLTSGIAYAFHPHRDTWYSAPMCQLNLWLPVYAVPASSGMVIYPRYWKEPVRNSSATYNYARWNQESRYAATQHLHSDTRVQPKSEQDFDLAAGLIVNGAPGSLTIFSTAQLHASTANMSGERRFSIDFRTVHLDDVVAANGAANIDSQATGTTMGDYLRGSDLEHIPGQWIQHYDTDES